MWNKFRLILIITCSALLVYACGDDETSSSTAGEASQQPVEQAVVASADTVPATPAPAETPVSPGTKELSHPVVYQEEIYKNWPYTEAPQPAPTAKAPPEPQVLFHPVVYQEEIYKNWPYTEVPQPTSATGVSEVVAETVGTAVAAAGEKVDTVVTGVQEQVESASAAVAGQLQQITDISGGGETHTINAEARAFNPDVAYIKSGDTVAWINMTSHNSVSIDGLIPAGAAPWRGQLGENLKMTLAVEGIYSYVCEPHIGFGMMGVIVVGKPTNLEEVKAYADKNMQGPYRRILGKLNKVSIP